jgi:hypothetical protein
MSFNPFPFIPPINYTNFLPAAKNISGLTDTNPTVITTTVPHNYLPGLFIRLFVPYSQAPTNLFGPIFPITILSPTTFSIPFDATTLQLLLPIVQKAQVIPVSELASTLQNAEDNHSLYTNWGP